MRTSSIPRRRGALTVLAGALALAALLSSGTAHADPLDDLKAAYNKALGQYNNLELDPALQVLDGALASAAADDPATAPLRMLRAVIIFSNTGKKDQTVAAFVLAVKADYNIALPPDLRSPDLQKLLDKARKDSKAQPPAESLRHSSPAAEGCGQDLKFEAITSGIPDGGQAVLYWRPAGEKGEFKSVTMDAFGSIATATVLATDHGDKSVEYFLYVFDGANKPLGNKGDQENPLSASVTCSKEEPKPVVEEKPPEKPKHTLPRVFINIGLGTGVGVARGVADQSYSQYDPFSGFNYGLKEFACAIARWSSGTAELPADQLDYLNTMGQTVTAFGAPYDVNALAMAYDAGECGRNHAVKTGMASAPFHVAPEIGGRIAKNLVLSGFGRLQLVTGSQVFRDDPDAALAASYMNDVTNVDPPGKRVKPGFTAAGGLKIKYFLGSDEKKFRLFVGGFLGGGFTRLRVPMGFANDRNGNSVPDDKEFAFDTGSGQCVAVWPYQYDCANPNSPQSQAATMQAAAVAANADKSQRIDTVRIGGGLVGATFGFHYQIVKNFALFGELQLGVWFPRTTSFLIDLNVGPAITF